jgi:outer membrane lipoprotein-sorting protein
MPKKILAIYAMGVILLAIVVVISIHETSLNSKTLLTQMTVKFEKAQGYKAIIHETTSILNNTESSVYLYLFKKPNLFKIQDIPSGEILTCNGTSVILYNGSNSDKKDIHTNIMSCEHIEDINLQNIFSYFKNVNLTLEEYHDFYRLSTIESNSTIMLLIRKEDLLPVRFSIISENMNYTLIFQNLTLIR